jgi:hypothetical protein
MAKKNPNPNNVTPRQVDDVFKAQVTEKLRKNPTYLQQEQAQKDLKLKQAQEIVDKANKGKKK